MKLRNPNCQRCPLHETARTVCVGGDGPIDAEVVVIGEAPGDEEDRSGRPFVGRSGKLIREELRKAGLNSVYITNIVKCRPPDNRAPAKEEIAACRKYLEAEIAMVNPKYVLTLGAPSTKEVLKKAKITEVHGQIIDMPTFQGMPAFHPAYCLRDPSKLPSLKRDLKRLRDAIDGNLVDDEGIPWRVLTKNTLRQFIREFIEADRFSFDLETSGLFPFDHKGFIRCVGIGLPKRAWVIRMEMPDSPFQGSIRAQTVIMRLLQQLSKGKFVVAHNGKFDNHWLYQYYGVRFRLDFDTMLAHHVIDENSLHGLKELSRQYLGIAEYDLNSKQKKGSVENPMTLYEYNAKDCAYTLQLSYLFEKELVKDEPSELLFHKLVMPGARALENIERRGLTLDMPAYARVEAETRIKHAQALEDLHTIAGKRINWNSSQQVAKLLFDELGIKSVLKTPKGKPSTSEAALIELKGTHPVVDQLFKYRELEKFLSTYIQGWKEHMVEDRLYLGYKVHGTVTGRYSSRLHQVPRDGTIRNLVVAPPGWDFVQGDLSQAELRIAAELSRDIELVTAYRRNIDVHWRTLLFMVASGKSEEYVEPAIRTAKAIIAGHDNPNVRKITPNLAQAVECMRIAGHEKCIAYWKGWKEARKKAKAINFGFLYGMYPKKFIETAKTKYGWTPTFEEAQEIRDGYFELYQGIPKWHERVKKLVAVNGFVRNLAGRVRHLETIRSPEKMVRMEAERQAINSPVQGIIGDIKAMAMIEIEETIPKDVLRIVGEHHDAILMIAKNGETLNPTLRRVRDIMRHPALFKEFNIDLAIPLEAELDIGPWGAGKTWSDPADGKNLLTAHQ